MVEDGTSAKTIKLPHKSISVSGPPAIPSLLVDIDAGSAAATTTPPDAGAAGVAAAWLVVVTAFPLQFPFDCWHLQANLSLQYVRL